ncbi:MAG: helix-turn-helix domain-containing protein, partial [Bacteroidales bacterium]|nr:helix-turn-helix domain-containing protein [Bacteroidales bacterium]
MKVLENRELGRRVAELRKNKGLSQVEMSEILKISRSACAQIELGNRNISVIELKMLSEVFNFSIDYFLSDDYNLETMIQLMSNPEMDNTPMRISVPNMQSQKFKNVLLYILAKCAGKPNVGETLIYKLLYFSDFNYYEIYEEHLTGAQNKKMPYGPVPQKIEQIIQKMIVEKELQRIKTEYHDYPQTRYIPL